jgi:asparagine N-glycosylation enzyme membrane subunit Stt3
METKIKALISLAIIVILLFIIIRLKIKSDKKTKSLQTPYIETINAKVKKSFLSSFPSGVTALLSLIVFTIVLFVVDELVHSFDEGGISAYALYGLLSATACFFIIKQNPKSIWYVPLIINSLFIFAAIAEPYFWRNPPEVPAGIPPEWIPVCSGWVLTIVVSIIGARMRKRKAISDNP